MIIQIKFRNQNPEPIQVNCSDTILDIKHKLKQITDLPIEKQKLFFSGKCLEDCRKITDYGIRDKDILIFCIMN